MIRILSTTFKKYLFKGNTENDPRRLFSFLNISWYHFSCIFKKNVLIELCFYLEQFLKGGWTLVDSLKEIVLLVPFLKKPLEHSIHLIEKGIPFSQTLENCPLFDYFFRSCIAVYEKTGTLEEGIKELGIYLKWKKDFKHQLLQALLYPFFSFTLLIIAGVVLYTFFVPELLLFLESMHQDLPFSTTIVLFILKHLGEALELLGGFLLISYILFNSVAKLIPPFRLKWDQWKYKLPYSGKMKKKQDIIHFLKIIEVLHRQRGDIIIAVRIAMKSVPNTYFHFIGEKIIENLLKGQIFSQALEGNHFIPSLVTKILKTGEKTNSFLASLQMIFYFYEQQLKQEKFLLLTLLQPLLLLCSGILLGTLLYSLFSPLYNVMGDIL